ncbi:MAG: sensor histidine kinase [Chloroflexota bacterium]
MKQPIEKNLLRTFRLFLLIRLIMTLVSFVARVPPQGIPVLTMMNVIVVTGLLIYLSSERIHRIMQQLYLPVALVVVTLHLIIEQRLIQIGLTRLGQSDIREIPPWLESFTLPEVEGVVIPVLLTLMTLAFMFVPLVILSWQYRFRVVIAFTAGIFIFDTTLVIVMSYYIQMDLPFEILANIVSGNSFLIVGYIVTRIMATQREQKEQLATVNRQLVAYATTREQLFVTQERNRLARELHDTLAHTMSAVTVKLNAVGILWEKDSQRAQTMLNEVIATLNDGNDETRRALRDLRASPLDDMGLVLAIRNLAESAAQRGNFALDLQTPTRDMRFSPDIEQAIYRIAQESLANVVEHAEASHVSVVMDMYDAALKLTIRDNGTGFPMDTVELKNGDGHFGLLGMQERASMINGTLVIDSKERLGTSVSLTVETAL